MNDAGAWRETPALAFLHRQVRTLLLRSGVEWHTFSASDLAGDVGYYAAGPATADEPIVLLHGLADSAHTWTRILRPLSAVRRVYALNLPGHGWTPAPERGWATVPEHADFLETFRQRVLGDRDFTLVGHSLGGWIAAKYAARPPSGLTRLILIGSAGLHYDGMEEKIDILRIESARDVETLWQNALHRVPWALRLFNSEVAALYRAPAVRGLVESWSPDHALHPHEAQRIRAATTIVWGDKDALTPPALAERFRELIPDSHVTWLEGCGHGPQLEQPAAVIDAIQEALHRPPGLRFPPPASDAPTAHPTATRPTRDPGSSGTP